jgi:hypothetical protein
MAGIDYAINAGAPSSIPSQAPSKENTDFMEYAIDEFDDDDDEVLFETEPNNGIRALSPWVMVSLLTLATKAGKKKGKMNERRKREKERKFH